jgi:hypothetical protein
MRDGRWQRSNPSRQPIIATQASHTPAIHSGAAGSARTRQNEPARSSTCVVKGGVLQLDLARVAISPGAGKADIRLFGSPHQGGVVLLMAISHCREVAMILQSDI